MSGNAWVTLATNDSYSLGALVLAHSLKQTGTKHHLAVLVTPGVTNSMRQKLAGAFDLVQEVNVLDSKDESNLRLLKRPELGITFTKLHCWRLTQFEKCVFLDADTLVLKNADELFEREEFSAAPDVGWPDCFNSGVFVYKPSNETFEKLIQFALEKGSFDGGDQGLLNLYFNDWSTKDIKKHLPFIYNMCSTASYSYLPAFKQFGIDAKIVHFIGNMKPWLQYFNTETKEVQPSPELQHLKNVLQLWWNIFCAQVHSNLSTDMSPESRNEPFFIDDRPLNQPYDYRDVPDPWEDYCSIESQTITPLDYHNTNSQVEYHDYIPTEIATSSVDLPVSVPVSSSSVDLSVPNPISTYSCDDDEIEPIKCSHDDVPIKEINSISPNESSDCTVPMSHCLVSPSNIVETHIYPVPLEIEPVVPISIPVVEDIVNNPCTDNENDEEDGGLAGAFAQFSLGAPRPAGLSEQEDFLRRQAWELGNIDYMGRDSFDNIWSKISETLSGLQVTSVEEAADKTPPEKPKEEKSLESVKSEAQPEKAEIKDQAPIGAEKQAPEEALKVAPLEGTLLDAPQEKPTDVPVTTAKTPEISETQPEVKLEDKAQSETKASDTPIVEVAKDAMAADVGLGAPTSETSKIATQEDESKKEKVPDDKAAPVAVATTGGKDAPKDTRVELAAQTEQKTSEVLPVPETTKDTSVVETAKLVTTEEAALKALGEVKVQEKISEDAAGGIQSKDDTKATATPEETVILAASTDEKLVGLTELKPEEPKSAVAKETSKSEAETAKKDPVKIPTEVLKSEGTPVKADDVKAESHVEPAKPEEKAEVESIKTEETTQTKTVEEKLEEPPSIIPTATEVVPTAAEDKATGKEELSDAQLEQKICPKSESTEKKDSCELQQKKIDPEKSLADPSKSEVKPEEQIVELKSTEMTKAPESKPEPVIDSKAEQDVKPEQKVEATTKTKPTETKAEIKPVEGGTKLTEAETKPIEIKAKTTETKLESESAKTKPAEVKGDVKIESGMKIESKPEEPKTADKEKTQQTPSGSPQSVQSPSSKVTPAQSPSDVAKTAESCPLKDCPKKTDESAKACGLGECPKKLDAPVTEKDSGKSEQSSTQTSQCSLKQGELKTESSKQEELTEKEPVEKATKTETVQCGKQPDSKEPLSTSSDEPKKTGEKKDCSKVVTPEESPVPGTPEVIAPTPPTSPLVEAKDVQAEKQEPSAKESPSPSGGGSGAVPTPPPRKTCGKKSKGKK